MTDWEKIGKHLFDTLWKSFPDFDPYAENAQEEWENLRWNEKQHNIFKDWAVDYLRRKGVAKRKAEKEVGMFMLKYSPKFTEEQE